MSAFGSKADMTFAACPLSRSLFGVKRTCLFAAHMSAYDPKRTSVRKRLTSSRVLAQVVTIPVFDPGGGNETARVHQIPRRQCRRVAAHRARAAARPGSANWGVKPL